MSALLQLFPLEMRDHHGRKTADSREFLLEFGKKPRNMKAPKRARCTVWSEGALLAASGWHVVTVPVGAPLQVSVTWKSGCETFLLSIPALRSAGLSSAWSI